MRILMTIFAAVLGLTFASGVAVAGGKKPFTATALQSLKGKQVETGQIFVSDTGTRFEYTQRGRQMVKIVLPEQKIMRILFPQEKLYMEINAPKDTPVHDRDAITPCPPLDGLTCTKVSDAKFGALNVEQWQQHHAPSNTDSMQWWEPQRKMVVRQEFPDGRIMQLAMVGIVNFDGRQTERWDISVASPGGKIANAFRLIDTELGIIVKEEDHLNAMSRELRGLKVQDSDASWFDVPAGYRRIEAPQRPQGATY